MDKYKMPVSADMLASAKIELKKVDDASAQLRLDLARLTGERRIWKARIKSLETRLATNRSSFKFPPDHEWYGWSDQQIKAGLEGTGVTFGMFTVESDYYVPPTEAARVKALTDEEFVEDFAKKLKAD